MGIWVRIMVRIRVIIGGLGLELGFRVRIIVRIRVIIGD